MIKYKAEFLKFWLLDEFDEIHCWLCNVIAWEFDHIEGRRKGLVDHPINLFPICRKCHDSKKGREFKQKQREILIQKIDEKFGKIRI